MSDNKCVRLLAYVTGLVNQELLLQNEYLAAENRILKEHLQASVRLSDGERTTLAEIGRRLGRKALQQIACIGLDLAPPSADRFIVGVAPIDYSPVRLLMPFGFEGVLRLRGCTLHECMA